MSHQRKRGKPRPIARARQLRRDATTPERLLWAALRGSALGGLKFRRQQAIGPYIIDFYCHCAALAVEIDGMSHDDRAQADQRRTQFLGKAGVRVVRFTNDDVLADVDAVASAILRAASGRA